MKVAIVHSDESSRAAIMQSFARDVAARQIELTGVASCEQALELFDVIHPDLMLVHLEAGEESGTMTGRDLCQEIRATEGKRHTGLVFLSDKADSEQRADELSVDMLGLGADDVLYTKVNAEVLLARVRTVLRFKAMTDELRSANHRLKLLSMTDDLTGLPNMRCFNQKFMAAIRRCRDGKTGLAVVMLDLDHFKSVNDTSNHLVGSHVLSTAGKLMRNSGILAESDIIARYGGDEFVMYLPTKDPQVAMAKAEAIRQAIAATVFEHDRVRVQLTASIGVAWTAPGFDGRAEDLIKAADIMLYRSKEFGRNRVSGMILRYPIDFDHISRAHLIDGDASSDDNHVIGLNKV